MSKETPLNWYTVDTDTLPANVKASWAKLQKAQEAARQAKEDFEAAFTVAAKKAERIDDEVSLAFGYRFGRLAIAKVDKEAKPKASSKPKFSF